MARKQTQNAFEAWFKKARQPAGAAGLDLGKSPRTGEYTSPTTRLAWQAYIAGSSRLSNTAMRLLAGRARERSSYGGESAFVLNENQLWEEIKAAMDLPD